MDIILQNEVFSLTVGEDCIVKSLTLKATGREFAAPEEEIALFAVTQDRPFNNEIKLAHPNKRTVFQGNRLRREGDRLIVGFETTPFEAVVSVREAARYIAFELEDFIVRPSDYGGLCMTPPPVASFRLLQLPVKKGDAFGEWLNVSWDGEAAVNVLSTSPYAIIDSEKRARCRILTADAVRGIKLKGCGAALIAAPETEGLLDAIADLEEDFDLPRGVESRRHVEELNDCTYFTGDINPLNVDEHLRFIKKCGFRKMQIYYTAMFKEEDGYSLDGNYDYRPEYPNGRADLAAMLKKIRDAGVTPGIHFLQTHIGLKSRYVTPVADHRLGLTQRFTLSRPLDVSGDVVYVEESTEGAEMHPKRRVLRFGGELISYEGYTSERPYRFTGCKRGVYETNVAAHPAGESGGVLDISEFGATSVYIDQNTDLQDEIAGKLADAYDAGFGFIYFDGSEGTNAPYDFHVPNAQYRVYKRLGSAPVFTEGAAKAHFSWHFLSRGNAFDVFAPDIFKSAIDVYPAEEAPHMRRDLTCVDFGWWAMKMPGTPSSNYEYQRKLYRDPRDYDCGTQADHYEYGASHAAAWDCPVTIQFDLDVLRRHPRIDDILEVLRRWQDVREKNWLTAEQKELLREPGAEYTLLINESGAYELVRCERLDCCEGVRAFAFERGGKRYVSFWHISGEGMLSLPVSAEALEAADEIASEWAAPAAGADGNALLPVGAKRYLRCGLSAEALKDAFKAAKLL